MTVSADVARNQTLFRPSLVQPLLPICHATIPASRLVIPPKIMSTAIEENWKPNKVSPAKFPPRLQCPTPKLPASRRESPEASTCRQLSIERGGSCFLRKQQPERHKASRKHWLE